MKKTLLLIVTTFCFLTLKSNVFAVCDNNELNDWAEEVSIVWELPEIDENAPGGEDGTLGDETEHIGYAYLIKLSSYKDNIKVIAKDTENTKEYEVEYDNDLKTYAIASSIHADAKTYTIEIYMKDDAPSCPGEKLRTLTYRVPAYNKYINTKYCDQNPKDELCVWFRDPDKNTEVEISKKEEIINQKNEIDSKTLLSKIFYYLKMYGLYVLIPLVLVSTYYIIKIKKYKKKEDEL